MKKFPESGILVEAESFDEFGGWVLDSQFEVQMGSPYLLAHGNGKPVKDATTVFSVTEPGEYKVWVRSKDWVPGHHPGRFTLAVNGTTLDTEFGANDQDWNWQLGGSVRLSVGETRLILHDLTGFCGRIDAIFFCREDTAPPEDVNEATRAWRRKLRGLPNEPVDAGFFNVVVVGGGVPGAAAALAAARLGERVALVQDRPYLGGNASVEIGLRPRGLIGPLVDEISQRTLEGDLYAKKLLEAEPNATVFLEHTVYSTVTIDSTIVSIDARDARSGREIRLSAPVFIDCSGKAILGLYSGAETLYGQESKAEYNESHAPLQSNYTHHGNTVFFRTRMADSPVPFPPVPWAIEVAKDFSDLGGQLKKPGIDNGEGPLVRPANHVPDPTIPRRMTMPLTHFWEYGQSLDSYMQGEQIRDHLLRAIYGTFSNVKTKKPGTYANLEFDWVAFVAAQGEFRRYKGDYVLNETDIRTHRKFPDAVVQNDGAFCLHYGGDKKYDFRLKWWEWDERDGKPYDIPFRCLYSTNISNLMMAGKHLSVTHVAGSNTKFMGNGAQHAIATAAAAHLCNKYNTTPRGIYQNHLSELQTIATAITKANYPTTHNGAKL
jgi:pimeloyl-ACP methyl ester carboxylesterase